MRVNVVLIKLNLNAMDIYHFDTYLDYVCVLIIQGFHNLFAYGCPDEERGFDKRRDKERLKRLYNIYSYY